jgi:hypothetical protein
MTTVQAAAARRVSCQLDTLWDFDDEPTHHELESLYVTEVPIPWLERLEVIDERVAPRYREIGLLD